MSEVKCIDMVVTVPLVCHAPTPPQIRVLYNTQTRDQVLERTRTTRRYHDDVTLPKPQGFGRSKR
ncbi:hypothetical protein SAMN05443247_06157 [Bradyrhizobium erythrophlei]|jgi:hypothetical protein|nr:hypothetical protein SAMN05443247_06157 [Bradyrhizobium erythrophlei]